MLKNDFLCFMLLGSKEHSDCLKVDLNAAKIIAVQDYKRTKN